MQLTEAITIIRRHASLDLPARETRLLTGFNPLHLQTFLQAHLQQRSPKNRVVVSTDVFGDLTGALTRLDRPAQQLRDRAGVARP